MTERRRYYPIRKHLQRMLLHPTRKDVSVFRIVVRNELHFNNNSVGTLYSVVYLDCDHGDALYELYRPKTDRLVRAEECAALLREYLDKAGKPHE